MTARRRGKRNGVHGARFRLRWKDEHGMWCEKLWPLRHRDGPRPAQIDHAAFRFGVPEGTPVECVCRVTGVIMHGTSQDPKADPTALIRKREKEQGRRFEQGARA